MWRLSALSAGVLLFSVLLLFQAANSEEVTYHFDEELWTGAVAEILDDSSNNYHATAVDGPVTAETTPAITGNPGTCGYGLFDGVDDYVALPAGYPSITTNFSITAWIRTTNNTRSGQRIFIYDTNNSKKFGFSLGDGGTGKVRFSSPQSTHPDNLDTPNVIANNTWYFVAAVADIINQEKRVYVYDQAGNQLAAVSENYKGHWGFEAGDAFIGGGDNASGKAGSKLYFSGNIDEVKVHDGALSQEQIEIQLKTTHLCLRPVLEYRFDECDETDTAIDGSTNGLDGEVLNGPLTMVEGKICNGASFDGVDDYVVVDDSDLFDNTRELTIAGWINPQSIRVPPAGTNARGIIAKRNDASSNVSYGIFFYSSVGDGKLYIDIDTTNNRFASNAVIPEDTWTHFAVVFNGNLAINERVTLYINGAVDKVAKETSTQIPDYNSNLYIGNLYYGLSQLKVFKGIIDELRVIPEAISQADVQALYNDNRAICGECNEPIDHYRMYHDGTGLTCSPENILIRACLDEDCTTQSSGAVNVALSPTKWLAGDTQTINSGATLQLWHTTAETATLDIIGTRVADEALNPPRCFVGATEQPSCQLTFHDSGFIFDVADHIADIEQDLMIAAVRKDLNSERCVPGFQNVTRNVSFWADYLDSTSGTLSVNVNNTAVSASSPGTAVSLAFNNIGEANIKVRYADVGQMRLSALYQGSGDDEGLEMTGADTFIARPDHFEISVADNPAANDADGGVFKKASESFSIEVSAHNASGNVTPNYGRENVPETVKLASSLVAPAGGNIPPIEGSFQAFGLRCDGGSGPGYTCGQFNWGEVGIIALLPDVGDGDYLGTGNVTGNLSDNIGRFIPDHFDVTILPDPPSFAESCLIYTSLGQSFDWDTVPELTIRAMNGADPAAVTGNYEGDFWKLDTTLIYSYVDVAVPFAAAPLTPQTVSRTMPDTSSANGLVMLELEEDDGISGNGIFDGFNYTRPAPTNPVAPFDPDVTMTVDVAELTDSDGVCYSDITGCIDYSVENIVGVHLRHGRGFAEAVFGPETSPLIMPVNTYWWDGAAWLENNDDGCTTLTYAYVQSGTSVTVLPTSPLAINKGAADLTLTPTAGAGSGTVSVSFDFPAWLAPDPSAVATFGIFRGNDRILNWQEIMR